MRFLILHKLSDMIEDRRMSVLSVTHNPPLSIRLVIEKDCICNESFKNDSCRGDYN